MLPRRLNKILIVKKTETLKESDKMLSVNERDRRKRFSFKFIFNICWRCSYRNTRKNYIDFNINNLHVDVIVHLFTDGLTLIA